VLPFVYPGVVAPPIGDGTRTTIARGKPDPAPQMNELSSGRHAHFRVIEVRFAAMARSGAVTPRWRGAGKESGPSGAASCPQHDAAPLHHDRQAGAYFHDCPPDPGCVFCGTSTATPAPDPWLFVDAAYCISLQERDDRTRSAIAELHRVGLCRKTRFYRPRRHDGQPWVGIWHSHRDVAREALAEGHGNVLVLEDDVRFSRLAGPKRIRAVERAFRRLPADWWIFYLGHWPLRARLVRRDTISTTSACTHAYVAGLPLLQWLDASDPAKIDLDHRWARVVGRGLDAAFAQLPGAYACFPMLAVQNTSPSDHIRARNRGRIRQLRHVVTRTRMREYLMSKLMRPNELFVVARSSARIVLERVVPAARRF
jgi:hypothetical protein